MCACAKTLVRVPQPTWHAIVKALVAPVLNSTHMLLQSFTMLSFSQHHLVEQHVYVLRDGPGLCWLPSPSGDKKVGWQGHFMLYGKCIGVPGASLHAQLAMFLLLRHVVGHKGRMR